MKVKKKNLLFIAGFVWIAAGINILRIGITSFVSVWGGQNLFHRFAGVFLAITILTGFLFMFRKIVAKHSERILNYAEEKKSVFLFFDLRGYLMMGFMMALGLTLRHSHRIPVFFFAFFYTGLGTALFISGLRFVIRFFDLGLRQIIWICVGLGAFSFGTLGIFLPILPTVPLYLLASFAFLNSSETLYTRFRNSKYYKKYLKPYTDMGGIPLKQKMCLIAFVTLQIGIAALLLRNSAVGLGVLGAVYAGFLISMLFVVKTPENK